jgi:8-oxo-dGTP diphosphatase
MVNLFTSERIYIPVVCAICINSANEILVFKKREGKANAGLWEFPGGKVEHNEKPEQALIREIKEELGVDILIVKHAATVHYCYPEICIELIGFIVTLSKLPDTLKDHDDMKFVPANALNGICLAPADRELITKYGELSKTANYNF